MKLPAKHRLRRLLAWAGGILLVLVLLLGAAAWFLLGTEGGARWLFTRLGALVPGSFEVTEINGPLTSPLDIRGLVYERDGLSMHIDHVQLEWRLRELLSRRLDIQKLYADGIRIVPTPSKTAKTNSPLPDLNLRFNIALHDARVTHLQIGAPGTPPFVIDRVDLATTAVGSHFKIERFTVRSPTLDGDVTGSFQPQGDYPVDLDARWTVRAASAGMTAPFSGHGPLTGTLMKLHVRQTLSGPFPAGLEADLTEPLANLRFAGKLAFADFNPKLFKADLPDLPASGEVAIQGTVDTFASTGTVRGNADPLLAGAGPVAVAYSLHRDGGRWTIDRAGITLPGTPTRLDASGVLTPQGQDFNVQATARWQNLRWPLRASSSSATAPPLVASARGEANVAGRLDAYRAELRADLTQAPGGAALPGHWTIAGTGSRERFRFERLQGALLAGRVEGTGEVVWKPQLRWNAVLRGAGINPQILAADFPGNLSFEASTRGTLAKGGPEGTVSVPRVRGELRGQPVAGAVDVALHGQRYDLPRFDLTWGNANLTASGQVAPTYDLAWRLSAPNLGIAVPQGGGSVVARGRISGSPKTPRVEVHAQGDGVRFGTTTIARAAIDSDVDLAPGGPFTLDVRSTDVRSGDRRLTALTVQGRGTEGSHTVAVAAVTEDGRLDLALAGGLAGAPGALAWNGQVRRLDLQAKQTGNWRLEAPAALAASAAAVRLSDFCWRSGTARLCVSGGRVKAGTWDVDATLAALPLNTFRPFLPTDLQITGDLNGHVKARGAGAVLASADVDLRPGPGDLRFPGAEGKTVAFHFEQGVVHVVAGAGGAGQATANLTLANVGSMSARLDLPRLAPGAPWKGLPLAGRIDIDLRNLAFVEGFVPEMNRPAGTLSGGYALSGTLGDPRFVGEARLRDGQADLPRFGLKLRAFQLAATGDGSGALALDGSLRSGPGSLTLRGRVGMPGLPAPTRLAIQGQRFQISDTEEIRAQISPDLTFTAQGNKVDLTGQVVIPEAKVDIEKRGPKGPVKVSKDVILVNGGAAPAPRKAFALASRVRVVLGDSIQIAALGLAGKPTGSLLVIDEPGNVTRGVGEIEINEGTFKAYGQDLSIERGRLIFNGPLTNPAIDIRASRKADDGTIAGIEAKGTAQTPQVTLWSDPPMAQSDALAYLLLGHPLNQTQPQEGDRLANAATALGLKGGNLLAKKLGARFGLEEARIETGQSLQQASLVVGKYLSPRLYVAYGLGLFEPVNTFRIRYLVNKKLTLQAERGSALGADALYTFER